MIKRLEHPIQTQIINYLKSTGWYVQRLNAGKYPIGEGRYRRFIQGVAVGTPDIMAFRHMGHAEISTLCEVVFIEVKAPGNKATDLQLRKMAELEEHGARCFVASSWQEVDQWLNGRI